MRTERERERGQEEKMSADQKNKIKLIIIFEHNQPDKRPAPSVSAVTHRTPTSVIIL